MIYITQQGIATIYNKFQYLMWKASQINANCSAIFFSINGYKKTNFLKSKVIFINNKINNCNIIVISKVTNSILDD